MKVLPVHEFRWSFKEGDVAVLSTPRPGSGLFLIILYRIIFFTAFHCSILLILSLCQAVRAKQNSSSLAQDDSESEITGRVVGTVRRHIPLDTRDPPGAILHYYVGDSYDPSRLVFNGFLLICFWVPFL